MNGKKLTLLVILLLILDQALKITHCTGNRVYKGEF